MFWLSVVVFSHEFVSQDLNLNSLHRAQLIAANQMNYSWGFESEDEIVSSFQADWDVEHNRATTVEPESEISLFMRGELIDPKVHKR